MRDTQRGARRHDVEVWKRPAAHTTLLAGNQPQVLRVKRTRDPETGVSNGDSGGHTRRYVYTSRISATAGAAQARFSRKQPRDVPDRSTLGSPRLHSGPPARMVVPCGGRLCSRLCALYFGSISPMLLSVVMRQTLINTRSSISSFRSLWSTVTTRFHERFGEHTGAARFYSDPRPSPARLGCDRQPQVGATWMTASVTVACRILILRELPSLLQRGCRLER
jgi:hypothetical protein